MAKSLNDFVRDALREDPRDPARRRRAPARAAGPRGLDLRRRARAGRVRGRPDPGRAQLPARLSRGEGRPRAPEARRLARGSRPPAGALLRRRTPQRARGADARRRWASGRSSRSPRAGPAGRSAAIRSSADAPTSAERSAAPRAPPARDSPSAPGGPRRRRWSSRRRASAPRGSRTCEYGKFAGARPQDQRRGPRTFGRQLEHVEAPVGRRRSPPRSRARTRAPPGRRAGRAAPRRDRARTRAGPSPRRAPCRASSRAPPRGSANTARRLRARSTKRVAARAPRRVPARIRGARRQHQVDQHEPLEERGLLRPRPCSIAVPPNEWPSPSAMPAAVLLAERVRDRRRVARRTRPTGRRPAPAGLDESPCPRASIAITRKCRASGARDRIPDRGAEAVRVVEQRERTAAAPVEQRDLDAALGQREAAAFDVFEHGRRESRRRCAAAATRPAVSSRGALSCRRVHRRRRCASGPRQPRAASSASTHAGPGLRAAAVALALCPGRRRQRPASCSRAAPRSLRRTAGSGRCRAGASTRARAPAGAALRELREEVGLELEADARARPASTTTRPAPGS